MGWMKNNWCKWSTVSLVSLTILGAGWVLFGARPVFVSAQEREWNFLLKVVDRQGRALDVGYTLYPPGESVRVVKKGITGSSGTVFLNIPAGTYDLRIGEKLLLSDIVVPQGEKVEKVITFEPVSKSSQVSPSQRPSPAVSKDIVFSKTEKRQAAARTMTWSVILSLVGVRLLYVGYSTRRMHKLIQQTPSSQVSALQTGLVEIHGKVEAPAQSMFKSPIFGKECVYYDFSVIQGMGKHLRTVARGVERQPFWVRDESGSVLIDPGKGQLPLTPKFHGVSKRKELPPEVNAFLEAHPPRGTIFGSQRISYDERLLTPGDEVYVLGTAQPMTSSPANFPRDAIKNLMIGQAGRSPLYISDRKKEDELVRHLGRTSAGLLIAGALACLVGFMLGYVSFSKGASAQTVDWNFSLQTVSPEGKSLNVGYTVYHRGEPQNVVAQGNTGPTGIVLLYLPPSQYEAMIGRDTRLVGITVEAGKKTERIVTYEPRAAPASSRRQPVPTLPTNQSATNLSPREELQFVLPGGIIKNAMYIAIVVIVLIILLASIRQVNQWQRGVKFMFGKFRSVSNPGWRLVIPVIQKMQKVDMRLKTVDVPSQDAITKDNVSAKINAVIYYKVTDAAKAIIDVQNIDFAVLQLAQTSMRNIAGSVTLDELLAERQQIAEQIEKIVDQATSSWGVDVMAVELKDIELPENMVRTIGKQAEAERERRAVIINSEGEVVAAQNLAKAAQTLSATPGALHLRTLNSINDISSDQSNTIVFTVPLEVLQAFMGYAKKKGE